MVKNEFGGFIDEANGTINPKVTMVNAGIGGKDLTDWLDPSGEAWAFTDALLSFQGVTPAQVQVVWMKNVIKLNEGRDFATWVQDNENETRQVLAVAAAHFPNLQQVFLSSRSYGGYILDTTRTIEPYAYEHGYAVKDVIADSVADPTARPWVGWGPYIWTDGAAGRSDGFTWLCTDVTSQGLHPSPDGTAKIAGLLDAHFRNSPFSPWFDATATEPTIASVTPGATAQGATIADLTVTGTNFVDGLTLTLGEGITVNSTTVVSSTEIEADITVDPAATIGYRDVTVTNPDLESAGLTDALQVTAPFAVTSVAPAVVPQNGHTHVIVSGTGFAMNATASFGANVRISGQTRIDDSTIDVNLQVGSKATVGPRTVTVTNAAGVTATFGGFSVAPATAPTAPTIASISPSHMVAGTTGQVTVTGTNFVDGLSMWLGIGVTVDTVDPIVDSTTFTATVTVGPAAAYGFRDLTVADPDGTAAIAPDVFQVTGSYAVLSASPASMAKGATGHVIVTGAGFQPGATADFGKRVRTISTVVIDDTTIDATVVVLATAKVGKRTITVTNPDSTTASCVCWSVTET
jgi:hypothetical protein